MYLWLFNNPFQTKRVDSFIFSVICSQFHFALPNIAVLPFASIGKERQYSELIYQQLIFVYYKGFFSM